MDKPLHFQIAEKHIGLKEIEGSKNNETIVGFHKKVSGVAYADETSWCAAFVGSCLLDAGIKKIGTLAARSYTTWGEPVLKPKIGDIVVFTRGSGWQGHVGFYAGETKDCILVLGGNQGNQVCIKPYLKSRLIATRRVPTK